MIKKVLHSFLLTAFFLLSISVYAGKVEKAFISLQEYNYFKAKALFEKVHKKNPSVSSFGLSIIYYKNDNPFHSIDSAFKYVQKSIDNWELTPEKNKLKWSSYGFTLDSILNVRQAISSVYFRMAQKEMSVDGFDNFAQIHPWSKEYVKAIFLRDSLAFNEANEKNNSNAYKLYLEAYPESVYKEIAEHNFQLSLFEEFTTDGLLSSFVNFVSLYPNSPMKKEAERKIFDIVTESNTEEAYNVFIKKYPKNHYADSSWKLLYQVYIHEYSKERMMSFLEKYPDSPFKWDVRDDIKLIDSAFLPYTYKGNYGFMNVSGMNVIREKYELTGFFQEGLAMAVLDGKYGFINKRDEVKIPFIYDAVGEFIHGKAIVELDGKYGMIDRNGKYIFECIFDDMGTFSDGLVYASLKDKYGFYDERGKLRVSHSFDDAFEFKNGRAKVVINDKQAFVDIYGSYVVPPVYEEIDYYFDTLYTFKKNDLIGFINPLCKVIIDAQYDEIGELKNGLAIASLDDEVVYLNELGKEVIQGGYETYPNYLLKGEFVKGVAIAVKGSKYGRIDPNGKKITDFKYSNIGVGADVFPFELSGKWGVINKANVVILKPQYQSLRIENENFVIAQRNDTTGVIDLNGKVVVPFLFKNIEYLGADVFKVQKDNYFGLYASNELIVAPNYEQIGFFNEDYLFLLDSERLSYYSLPDKKLIVPVKSHE